MDAKGTGMMWSRTIFITVKFVFSLGYFQESFQKKLKQVISCYQADLELLKASDLLCQTELNALQYVF